MKLPSELTLRVKIRCQRKLVRLKRGYVDPVLQNIVDRRNARLATEVLNNSPSVVRWGTGDHHD